MRCAHCHALCTHDQTTNDIDYLPTPDGIFSPLSATIVSSSSESSSDSSSDSDSDSDEEAESKQDEMSELMMAVYSLLAEEPPLIYNSEAVHEGLVVRTPHLSPTPPQIEVRALEGYTQTTFSFHLLSLSLLVFSFLFCAGTVVHAFC